LLHEVSMLAAYCAAPREGHLEGASLTKEGRDKSKLVFNLIYRDDNYGSRWAPRLPSY